jgi:hypothetical protein
MKLLKDPEVITAEITKFIQDHKLQVHPGQNVEKHSMLVIAKGGCPCVPGRNHCPCPEALEDIKKIGRCRCGILCNDSYIKTYNALKAQYKGATKSIRKPKRRSLRNLA